MVITSLLTSPIKIFIEIPSGLSQESFTFNYVVCNSIVLIMTSQLLIYFLKQPFKWHISMISYPLLHGSYLVSEFLSTGLNLTSIESPLRVHATIKRKSQKIKRLWLSKTFLCSLTCCIPTKLKNLCLFLC